MAFVTANFRLPPEPVGSRLLSFFNKAASLSPVEILKAVLEVDERLGALAGTFTQEIFGSHFEYMDFSGYPPDEKGVEHEVRCLLRKYDQSLKFRDQLEAWLQALCCSEVFVQCDSPFSVPTQDNILNIIDEYKRGRLAIFLGAGVSVELGMPLWADLITRLGDVYLQRTQRDLAIMTNLRSRSLIEQARWLKNSLGSDYMEALRLALYSNAYRTEIPESRLFQSISKMRNLRALCTYNFDDFLENQAKGPFVSVAEAKDCFGRSDIPVYHVHGLLPYVGMPRGDIILAEMDYHSLSNESTNWTNSVQINLLRECTCLLIGMSGSDPNLRRLLDLIGSKKSGNTYLIQKMDKVGGLDENSIKTWKGSKEFDREFFASINLMTVWIHDYAEIDEILQPCVDYEEILRESAD